MKIILISALLALVAKKPAVAVATAVEQEGKILFPDTTIEGEKAISRHLQVDVCSIDDDKFQQCDPYNPNSPVFVCYNCYLFCIRSGDTSEICSEICDACSAFESCQECLLSYVDANNDACDKRSARATSKPIAPPPAERFLMIVVTSAPIVPPQNS